MNPKPVKHGILYYSVYFLMIIFFSNWNTYTLALDVPLERHDWRLFPVYQDTQHSAARLFDSLDNRRSATKIVKSWRQKYFY